MIEFLFDYGLFAAKFGTITILIVIVIGVIAASTRRGANEEGLAVEHLNKRLEALGDAIRRSVHGKEQLKKASKEKFPSCLSEIRMPREFTLCTFSLGARILLPK